MPARRRAPAPPRCGNGSRARTWTPAAPSRLRALPACPAARRPAPPPGPSQSPMRRGPPAPRWPPWPGPGAARVPRVPRPAAAFHPPAASRCRTAAAAAAAVRAGRATWMPARVASRYRPRSVQRRAGALDLQQLVVDAAAGLFDRVAHGVQFLQRRLRAVLLQPQALPEHFLHGVADRVLAIARYRFYLGPGGAQPVLQGVGCV